MRKFFSHIIALSLLGCLLLACDNARVEFSPEVATKLPEQIDFNLHIKPILSDRCFACHGPDENKQEAGLRLDQPEAAFAALKEGDGYAIVAGDPHKSALFHRITSEEADFVMPPPDSNLELTELEVAMLTRWIEQGAEYRPHWSFLPPEMPEVPEVEQQAWAKNSVDNFILKRLEREDLNPAPEAEKVQLLRRVTFDLTGLPPTQEEIKAFVGDSSADAYEKVVDQLLASPAYGERMAMDWMDIARYADSHGYHADGYRMMWPWRDWVIKAFNDNQPYDEFVTWQTAGDLMPNATQEQELATGFHRNHPASSESGIVPEEYRLENVFDRTNTTAKALLGLTLECARCHDHKYDPISQKEYYQFSAFFNNVDEIGMIANDGNTAPTIPWMQEETAEKVAHLRKLIAEQEEKEETYRQEALPKLSGKKVLPDSGFMEKGLLGHYPLDQFSGEKSTNLASGGKQATLGGDVEKVVGKFGQAVHFNSEYESMSLPEVGNFERTDAFSIGAWVKPDKKEAYSAIIGNAGGKNAHWRGHEMYLDEYNRVGVRLTHGRPDHRISVLTQDSIPLGTWSHLMFTYDGSSKAAGIMVYVNGKVVPLQIRYNRLYKSIFPINGKLEPAPQPLKVGRSNRGALDIGLYEGAVDEIRVYDRRLSGLEVAAIAGNQFWKNKDQFSPEEESLLAEYVLHQQDPQYRQILAELHKLRQQEHATLDTVPEIMVMREKPVTRKTYVLDRGMYDAPKEEVRPSTLSKVLPFEGFPQNRLGLAQWLFHPDNPLTARVAVNRYWHMFFGRGIVGTLEDFGNQGDLPTHPELLDWLALEFQSSDWDVKALIRLIVTSATYRQSSVAKPELREKDPNNVLLARGPSHRLPAEMIRDNALAASGLLVKKVGGPSVKTYQPEGLWSKTHFSRLLVNYEHDEGEKLYRRSIYTFIRRTAPPPSMTVMDASDRGMCIVRRQRTSTPLQALLLLNEPQMVEAARLIAERVYKEGGKSSDEKLNLAFRLLTSRDLLREELPLMRELYEQELQKYREDQAGAQELMQVGEYPHDESLPLPQIAALTAVTNIMMNYDEVYTKR